MLVSRSDSNNLQKFWNVNKLHLRKPKLFYYPSFCFVVIEAICKQLVIVERFLFNWDQPTHRNKWIIDTKKSVFEQANARTKSTKLNCIGNLVCTFANSEEFLSSEVLDLWDYKQKNRKQCQFFNLSHTFHIGSDLQSENREHFCIFLMASKLMDLAIIMTKDMSARKCKCNE